MKCLRSLLVVAVLFAAPSAATGDPAPRIDPSQINAIYPGVEKLYIDLHQNPELAFQEKVAPHETEPLSWADICAQYPDQHVCLVDVEAVEFGSPEIKTARVVGCGPTRRAAFDPIRGLGATYPLHSVRFTGICTEPLIRPSLVIDDETLEILRS